MSDHQPHDNGTRRLVDPELLPFVEQYPRYDLTAALLAQIRAGLLDRMGTARTSADYPTISCREAFVPGCDGDPIVRVLIYEPSGMAPRPALLHIHAGGHVMGLPEMNDAQHRRIAHDAGCVVVSVDYRLAPEHRYPAGLHDCLAALRWLHASAAKLSINPAAIGLAGESAGAGVAVGLALLARDRGECPIRYLSLVAPMLDHRTGTADELPLRSLDLSWSRASNRFGWQALLGPDGVAEPAIYAAPARAESYADMPATYLAVGSLDLFAQENLAFAARLLHENVAVELHLYPGAYHGFDRVPDAQLTKQFIADRIRALTRTLAQSA